MDSISWIWHIGAGMIVGLSLAFAAWSAGERNDRRAPPNDVVQEGDAVTPRGHRTAHTAPIRKA